jgi:hypothetical protein
MKCEDFTANHEAGSALAKMRARIHARHCAKCAAVREQLIELRQTLSVPAEITPYHRRVWERAAADAAPEAVATPAWSWLTVPRLAMAGGLAVAAAIIVAIVLSVANNNAPDGERIAGNADPPSGVTILPLRILPEEVAQLENGLNQVEADLKRLAEEAALLDARDAISALAALYQPLVAGDST